MKRCLNAIFKRVLVMLAGGCATLLRALCSPCFVTMAALRFAKYNFMVDRESDADTDSDSGPDTPANRAVARRQRRASKRREQRGACPCAQPGAVVVVGSGRALAGVCCCNMFVPNG